MTAICLVPLDRLRDVLVPQAQMYEILALQDGHVESYTPRQFVVLPPKRAKGTA